MTPWTAALQTPLSMEFSKKVYLSGLPFFTPEANIQPPINVLFSTYCFFNYRNHFAYWKKLFYHKTNVLLNWIFLINWTFRKKYLSFVFKYFCSSWVFLKKYFVKNKKLKKNIILLIIIYNFPSIICTTYMFLKYAFGCFMYIFSSCLYTGTRFHNSVYFRLCWVSAAARPLL